MSQALTLYLTGWVTYFRFAECKKHLAAPIRAGSDRVVFFP